TYNLTHDAGQPGARTDPADQARRTADHRSARPHATPGTGNWGGDTARARRALNLATLEGMLSAYRRGGQAAIDKVMRHSPAIFLKMLVLLVPRELEVSHSGSIKAMSDQQIEDAIAAIEALLARRQAAMIDVTPTTSSREPGKTEAK